jgi:hypothetical protein
MGKIKPKTVSDLMDVATDLQMERMRATINALGHQRMIEETGMEVNAEDPATTTNMALTAK